MITRQMSNQILEAATQYPVVAVTGPRQSGKTTFSYDDIINHPHHVFWNHPQMPMRDRAVQFLPFATLTVYEEAVGETPD